MKNKKLTASRIWKHFEDFLIPRLRLSITDRAVYSHLLRHSRLEGKARLRFSIAWLARGARLSTNPARWAVRRLIAHGALRLLERSKAGHLVDVRLPDEIRATRHKMIRRRDARPLPRCLDFEQDFLKTRALRHAIERRRDKGDAIGDAFYETKVGPQIRGSDIDKWFEALDIGSNEDMTTNLETHKRVMDLFTKISGLEKRSLASKYLHFHFPSRFYIYDSRACTVISKLTKPIGKRLPLLREHDGEYARFSLRCLDLNQQIDLLAGRHLSPREFDKVLLAFSRP